MDDDRIESRKLPHSGGAQSSRISALTGRQKVAILLKAMDQDQAVKILARFPPSEKKELVEEMNRVDHLVLRNYKEIIDEFLVRFTRMAAPGEDAPSDMTGRGADSVMFPGNVDDKRLSQFLHREHPQTIAFALCSVPVDKAALLLSMVPAEFHAEVALRIATMEPPSVKMIDQFKAFSQYLPFPMNLTSSSRIGGIDTLAAILKKVPLELRRKIVHDMGVMSPELGGAVKSLLFTFADLAHLELRSMERLLNKVDNLDLATAIRDASSAVRGNVERCISERRRLALQKEMECIGDVTDDMAQSARKKILDVYLRYEETAP